MDPIFILKKTIPDQQTKPKYKEIKSWAPINIALCKYWGKVNEELKLPNSPSLSITLPDFKAELTLTINPESTQDHIYLNQSYLKAHSPLSLRINQQLERYRKIVDLKHVTLDFQLNIPLGAGLASSSCIFAALIKGLDLLFEWNLPKSTLSILARLGSGSACRSLWNGFVLWPESIATNPLGSHGIPLPYQWKELCIGILPICNKVKSVSSSEGMNRSRRSSPFYQAWLTKSREDYNTLQAAIKNYNLPLLGKIAEQNALAMHAVVNTSWPAFSYTLPSTLEAMQHIWQLRNQHNLPLYFTQDAGANLKLIFLEENIHEVMKEFPKTLITQPFLK